MIYLIWGFVEKKEPYKNIDGFEWSEDFDGFFENNSKKYFVNFKFICDSGGAQRRALCLVYHFINCQLHFLKKNNNSNNNSNSTISSAKMKLNKTKLTLINQNIAQSKFGMYSQCHTGPCVKNNFVQNFNIGEINNICSVDVVNYHPVDAISDYCNHGFNQPLKSLGDSYINPVAVCSIGEDFVASNFPQSEGIRDDTFNIRTNLNIIGRNTNYFPIRNSECVYIRYITVIRDQKLNAITDQQYLYRFSLICATPINKPKLLDENKMISEDFLKLMGTIETIFQTAISGNHNVLVLSAFGNTEDDVPQEDIVKIYNACIFKYGHKFIKIIIAIPIWYGTYIFNLFNDNIVRPQFFDEDIEEEETNKIKTKNKNIKKNKESKKNKNI